VELHNRRAFARATRTLGLEPRVARLILAIIVVAVVAVAAWAISELLSLIAASAGLIRAVRCRLRFRRRPLRSCAASILGALFWFRRR
jgi:hypothetical protein